MMEVIQKLGVSTAQVNQSCGKIMALWIKQTYCCPLDVMMWKRSSWIPGLPHLKLNRIWHNHERKTTVVHGKLTVVPILMWNALEQAGSCSGTGNKHWIKPGRQGRGHPHQVHIGHSGLVTQHRFLVIKSERLCSYTCAQEQSFILFRFYFLPKQHGFYIYMHI